MVNIRKCFRHLTDATIISWFGMVGEFEEAGSDPFYHSLLTSYIKCEDASVDLSSFGRSHRLVGTKLPSHINRRVHDDIV